MGLIIRKLGLPPLVFFRVGGLLHLAGKEGYCVFGRPCIANEESVEWYTLC